MCSYDDSLRLAGPEVVNEFRKSSEISPNWCQNRAMTAIYAFGPFRLDAESEILFRGTDPVALGQRAIALLRVLVEQPGVPISKDALIQAAWPGLAVEESNLTVQIAALRRVFGEEPGGGRWIETLARRGYRFVGPVVARDQSTVASAPALALPDRPSVAVLPFANMSGDAEQEYFADGIVEEIITALSRNHQLFVIARNSSFTYKGRAVDVKQVGCELGVRYILEGSVRKAANRVRIATQLIDATTGSHIWADRFDGTLDDIFDMQDRVATSVVGAIARKLEKAEIERSKRKPTENLNAYDLFLRGTASFYQRTTKSNSQALGLFYKAIQLDPNFASAYGMAAWCYAWRKVNGWMTDSIEEIAEGTRLARRAVELGNDDAAALARGGHALAHLVADVDSGIPYVDRALMLNPNLATAWWLSGWLRAYRGEPDVAVEHLAHAMRLSPLDPEMFRMQAGTAFAHLLAGRFDDALSWADKVLRDFPNFLPAVSTIAVTNALSGHMEEARRAVQHLRRLYPALRVSNLKNWFLNSSPRRFRQVVRRLATGRTARVTASPFLAHRDRCQNPDFASAFGGRLQLAASL